MVDIKLRKEKKYAKNKERSLSDLIENYLKSLTNSEEKTMENISPQLKSMKGAFKIPKDFDYKKEITERLTEKYL